MARKAEAGKTNEERQKKIFENDTKRWKNETQNKFQLIL